MGVGVTYINNGYVPTLNTTLMDLPGRMRVPVAIVTFDLLNNMWANRLYTDRMTLSSLNVYKM